MIKNRIALCIPTKDRFKCIEELLLDYPRINGICQMDIYIYDSSVDDVIERYGELSGNQLEALSHSELPWMEARNGLLPLDSSTRFISNKTIYNYYVDLLV